MGLLYPSYTPERTTHTLVLYIYASVPDLFLVFDWKMGVQACMSSPKNIIFASTTPTPSAPTLAVVVVGALKHPKGTPCYTMVARKNLFL
mmetsp:Transcript_73187/g.128983  ORF Transcript_73187/g.128983 Transcript_73187/m.128983 type:complete len:90 (+) Transcript_73187:173-442(+)